MDVYRIFKPVIFISRVFCLAPFAIVEDSGSTRYKFSTFWLLYSILGVCASFISQIGVIWITISFSYETLYNAFSQVATAAIYMMSFVVQVFCLINGKNVLTILDNVSVLDSEHSGARIGYYRLYRVFIVHLICCIISFVVLNIISFAAFDTNSVYMFVIIYYSTVYFISDAVLLISDTQFINFVLLLKYRFSLLNDTVTNVTVPSLYKTSLNHIIIAPSVDRTVNSSTSAVSSSITLLKSTLRKVCRHHDSLCDISEFVNRTYSFQILLSVAIRSIEFLVLACSLSSEFYNPHLNIFSSELFFSMSSLCVLFAGTAQFVQLVAVCNRTSHEVSGLNLWCPSVCFLNT